MRPRDARAFLLVVVYYVAYACGTLWGRAARTRAAPVGGGPCVRVRHSLGAHRADTCGTLWDRAARTSMGIARAAHAAYSMQQSPCLDRPPRRRLSGIC